MKAPADLIDLIAKRPSGSVTLNGKRAVISGFLNERATVETMAQPRISAIYSWDEVERVINNGGAFYK